MTASEANRQLVSMNTAAHEQGPVGTTIGYQDRGMRDRLPAQESADDLADRVACGPERTAERSRQSGRITGPHAAQVIAPAQSGDSPPASDPCADLPLQLDPPGWAGPAGRQGDLDRISRRIG